MYCSKCGNELPEGAVLCDRCGDAAKQNFQNCVSYDYKAVNLPERQAQEAEDVYRQLGWELAERVSRVGAAKLTFRRNRKIANKEQLNRLERKLDDSLDCERELQREKTKLATSVAITIGTLAALVFGGGMCLCLLYTELKLILAGCVLGVVGAGIGLLAWLAYRKIAKKKTAEAEMKLEKKRDEIDLILDDARKLV